MSSSPFAEFEYYLDNFDIESFGEQFFTVFAVIILVIFGLSLLVGIAAYVLESIGLVTIGKRRDIKNAWLAWIPFARAWALGAIVDEQDRRVIGKDRFFRIVYLVGVIIYALAIIGTISNFFTLADVISNMSSASDDMIFAAIAGIFAGFYGGIMSINLLSILLAALKVIVLYKLYESVTEKLPILFSLFSIFISLFHSISIFCLRKRGYEAPKAAAQLPEAVKMGWYDQD